MADDTRLNANTTTGDLIASDDIGGTKYQRIKLIHGADGVNAGDVSTANPLPTNVNAKTISTFIVPINRLVNTALAANTTRQQLSLEHAASATKTLRITKIHIGALNTTAVAGDLRVFVDYGTAASTAGTALSPQPTSGTTAPEITAKTLPTITAATTKFVAYVGSAAATANTSIVGITVYEWYPGSQEVPLTIRAGVLESLVIGIQSFGLNVYHVTGYVVFTEE